MIPALCRDNMDVMMMIGYEMDTQFSVSSVLMNRELMKTGLVSYWFVVQIKSVSLSVLNVVRHPRTHCC